MADADADAAPGTPVTLTPAEADRVLKIQDTLIASVRASVAAHKAATDRIAGLEAEKAALTARVAELASHEPNVVDPAAMQPALDELALAVAGTHAAVAPHAAPEAGQGGDAQPRG